MRIDPHVHLRDGGQSYKETIVHGLAVAKSQGVDIVFDMPNTDPPILYEDDVIERLALVPLDMLERYFLYVGLSADPDQIREAVLVERDYDNVVGLKMFAGRSTGNLALISEDEQRSVYRRLAELGYDGVLAVHCEKESHILDSFDPGRPYTHALCRPKMAEIESVSDQIRFARESGLEGVLHICHVSCRESVELVDEARAHLDITCGVTPHHLMWDDSRLCGDHGLLYKTNPPLRSKADVQALRKCLFQGKIDWLETDHAPHALGEKLHAGFPSGYPSLYIYKQCVEEFLPGLGLSAKPIEALTYGNIARAFGF